MKKFILLLFSISFHSLLFSQFDGGGPPAPGGGGSSTPLEIQHILLISALVILGLNSYYKMKKNKLQKDVN